MTALLLPPGLTESPADWIRTLPRRDQRALLAPLTEDELNALWRDWRFWARPDQTAPPGDWFTWPFVGGRGSGKTRTGAEFILDRSEDFANAGASHRVGLMGRTAADVRDVMIEGESGLEACAERRGHTFRYEPSKRRFLLPDLDTIGTGFSAEKPDQVRGYQFHTGWGDEVAAWRHFTDREGNTAWSNFILALRLEGDLPADWLMDAEDTDNEEWTYEPAPPEFQPRLIATTTPKPIQLVREWVKRVQTGDPSIVMSQASLYANKSHLAPRFISEIVARYEGTRLAAQEIGGLLIEAVEGALWTPENISVPRLTHIDHLPALSRIVIAVDPSGSTRGDECGIVVAAVEANPVDRLRRHVYVLDDLSKRCPPEEWAAIAVKAYHDWGAAAIVGEVNFGAALVGATIHLTDPLVIFEEVRASRGKRVRAEPIAALYGQHRAHHVGTFGLLEAQMTTWVPDDPYSPDRMDALVWAVSWLLPEITSPPASLGPEPESFMPTGAETFARGERAGYISESTLAPAA